MAVKQTAGRDALGRTRSVRPFYRPYLCPHSFLSLSEKEKNRRGVRRSQLHSVSAGAAKTPYPLAPSSFPKADRCAGSPFG